jgi:hypothetical protein
MPNTINYVVSIQFVSCSSFSSWLHLAL